MITQFKRWHQVKPTAIEKINPRVGIRNWNDLKLEEKERILKHFKTNKYFWVYKYTEGYREPKKVSEAEMEVYFALSELAYHNKKQSFCDNILNAQANNYRGVKLWENVLKDFNQIFCSSDENIFYEFLSIYAFYLFKERSDKNLRKEEGEAENDYIKRNVDWKMEPLDKFRKVFNDIFEQFEINVHMTRGGLVHKQSKRIIEDIYEPVLDFLTDPKWNVAQRDLKDAFDCFRLKTPQGYSNCITYAYSALQAFLQILVNDKTGKGDVPDLIKDGQQKSLLPKDTFSTRIFKDINSIIMQERQTKGDSHPKETYATEKHARLVLNLVMVFMQHCVLND